MKMKKVGWGVLSVFLILIAALYILKEFEVTESYYETYVDISSVPNIFESGWIPQWLPKTASQINESHDIDTNEAWIAFNFLSSDDFYKGCQRLIKNDVVLPIEKPAANFPPFVDDAIMRINSGELAFYTCEKSSNRYLAIDHKNLRAYSWANP